MKLNLGCGCDVRDGYVNVDLHSDHTAVVCHDLSKTPWPWESDSVDEVLMLDFLEHFPYRDTMRILFEANRVLALGGKIIVQVPDFLECSRAMNGDEFTICNTCGTQLGDDIVCSKCGSTAAEIAKAGMMRLYGGQDFPGNWHFTAFTYGSLISALKESGFAGFDVLERNHQRLNWNMKLSAIKTNTMVWD